MYFACGKATGSISRVSCIQSSRAAGWRGESVTAGQRAGGEGLESYGPWTCIRAERAGACFLGALHSFQCYLIRENYFLILFLLRPRQHRSGCHLLPQLSCGGGVVLGVTSGTPLSSFCLSWHKITLCFLLLSLLLVPLLTLSCERTA